MRPLLILAFLAAPALAIDVQVPPRAEVVERSSDRVQDYRIPLSALQDSGRDIRVDQLETLSGTRERLTLKLPRDTDVDQVFNQLKQADAVFECAARSCGRSNIWANNLYQIRQLYGRDRFQRYQAVAVPGGWRTLYVIERGNRDVYAHIEQVLDAQTLIGRAQAVAFDLSTPSLIDVNALAQAIDAQPNLNWVLQIEVAGSEGVAGLNREADALAQRLVDAVGSLPVRVRNLGATGRDEITLVGFTP